MVTRKWAGCALNNSFPPETSIDPWKNPSLPLFCCHRFGNLRTCSLMLLVFWIFRHNFGEPDVSKEDVTSILI
jgi:hypothetical protein